MGMAEHHPLARRPEVSVAALQDHPLLLPDPDAAQEWIDFVLDFCHAAGVDPPRWPHVTHGSTSAAEALREGECVTPTNRWIDPPADLVFRPLVDPTPLFGWSMMRNPHGPSIDTVALLAQCVRDLGSRQHWLPRSRPAARS